MNGTHVKSSQIILSNNKTPYSGLWSHKPLLSPSWKRGSLHLGNSGSSFRWIGIFYTTAEMLGCPVVSCQKLYHNTKSISIQLWTIKSYQCFGVDSDCAVDSSMMIGWQSPVNRVALYTETPEAELFNVFSLSNLS